MLGAVDTVFVPPAAHAGLTADPEAPVHEALPEAAPGLVEIWELTTADERNDVEPLGRAVRHAERRPARVVKLARARSPGTVAAVATARAGSPSDVLILVRRRGALFEAIIRALKNEGVPVAGADRLVLTEHIAVMDLMVLADALLLPEDDLALATVLKSPLFGLDDDELFKLAWDREGSLRAALRDAAARSRGAARRARASGARRMTPFAFYAELLGAERRTQGIPGAARPRGQRRARRISQSGARLRARARRRRCRASSPGCARRRPR